MVRVSWGFSDDQLLLIKSKQKANRLYYALQLKYYESKSEFFHSKSQISSKVIYNVAKKFGVSANFSLQEKRIYRSYKSEIKNIFKAHEIDALDKKQIEKWLMQTILPRESLTIDQLKEKIVSFSKTNRIKPYSEHSIIRLIKKTLSHHEGKLFKKIFKGLSIDSKNILDNLLHLTNTKSSMLSQIKSPPKGLSLSSILEEARKLKLMKQIALPDIMNAIPEKTIIKYYRNICTKYPSAIKSMPETARYAFLSVFVFVRSRQLTDNLIEILIRLIKKFMDSGKNKLKKNAAKTTSIKNTYNQKTLLGKLASAILNNEDGVVRDAIYPIVPKETLEEICAYQSTPPSYEQLVHEQARSSYTHHYRRMLFPILELIDFRSSNTQFQPIVEALETIKSQLYSSSTLYPENITIPIEGAIKKSHEPIITDSKQEKGQVIKRINRVNYEMCVLRNLRRKIRVKEVWVKGGHQYRNPEEDLPNDFEKNKPYYFDLIKKPDNAKKFIAKLKRDLNNSLSNFNSTIVKNKTVKILKRPYGHIKVSKLKAQSPPPQTELIKQEVFERWPNTSLVDVLKEADMFVDFLSEFSPSGPKEGLDELTLKKRLLLAILAYGTNTGLKGISAGNNEVSYQDLKHVKLRYFDADNFRNAIRKIINHLLKIKMPEIWSDCTTAVASDSTHIRTTDQNFMSQWHPRYRSKGVMIYWHVDTKSVCIYSQLKSCSSSEVSSMIEGVLRHCTDMSVEKNYVDTHGASEVGFAFSHMLNFELMPRYKNIYSQKLYISKKSDLATYTNIKPILSKEIKWDLIEKQYEQIVKYTIALKLGIANSEDVMRRFTRENLQHPTYKALSELGKVIKTIFLCRYLGSEELRQEINEGLNVVERWNGINDFIFYGNARILRSNKPEELELSMLCLHLLQISMVYINTLMLQQVIGESNWVERMAIEDKRAITPLLNEHINPYGLIVLNLESRLAVNDPLLKEAA